MQIEIRRKTAEGDRRLPVMPDGAGRLAKLETDVLIPAGFGASLQLEDQAYLDAGCRLLDDVPGAERGEVLLLSIGPPSAEDLARLPPGSISACLMDPFRQPEVVRAFAASGVTGISLDMMPRTTLAQKMDVLSSQASIAGYVAVVLAASRLNKVFPMMMTPAGTLHPARVFVIGAGVAGLQAIATARRLGARVEAFDTRPAVEEQVKSLGARFVKIDLGETRETRDGYARQLGEAQLAKQREVMGGRCAESDVVITTAQVFGRPAPRIITDDMIAGMQPGSVIVDMAVETGGNVEGSRRDEVVDAHGVQLLGMTNLAGRAAVHASQALSGNLAAFVEHFWDRESGALRIDPEDELMQGCLITRDGEVVHPQVRKALES